MLDFESEMRKSPSKIHSNEYRKRRMKKDEKQNDESLGTG